jgi:hypothetical protein
MSFNPAAPSERFFEFAVFLTGWGPIEDVERAEFYMGSAWGRRIFTATPDPQGHVGIVVRAYNGFLVLARVTFFDGRQILLNHYCNLAPGENKEDERLRDKVRRRRT